MFENKFVDMAVSEGGRPVGGDYTAENIVMNRLSFGIEMVAHSRESFLKEGINFLQNFESECVEEIRNEQEDGDNDQHIIEAYRDLIVESKQVDVDKFLNLLGTDWDERQQHADNLQ